MLSIALSFIIFTFVVMSLVAVITLLERRLVAQGNVKLRINDDKSNIEVKAGGTLLSALSNAGIYLPSACGGGGDLRHV